MPGARSLRLLGPGPVKHPESISNIRRQFLRRPGWTTIALFLGSTIVASAIAALLLLAISGSTQASFDHDLASIVLFFWGVGNLDQLRDSAIGAWVLAVLALARIIIPALLVSVLFHRLMHPPRATTLAPRLFLWKRPVRDDKRVDKDQPVLTIRIYNRLPMPLTNVELRAFLRRSEQKTLEQSESEGQLTTVIKTKKLEFQEYDTRGKKPRIKAAGEIKKLSILYPSSPFSVYLPLTCGDITETKDGDSQTALELEAVQGACIKNSEAAFLLISISGTISESASTFQETSQFNLAGGTPQIAAGKYYDLPPKRRTTPSRPIKAIEAALWDNWKYFEMTQAEADAALSRPPWYQRLRNS